MFLNRLTSIDGDLNISRQVCSTNNQDAICLDILKDIFEHVAKTNRLGW